MFLFFKSSKLEYPENSDKIFSVYFDGFDLFEISSKNRCNVVGEIRFLIFEYISSDNLFVFDIEITSENWISIFSLNNSM